MAGLVKRTDDIEIFAEQDKLNTKQKKQTKCKLCNINKIFGFVTPQAKSNTINNMATRINVVIMQGVLCKTLNRKLLVLLRKDYKLNKKERFIINVQGSTFIADVLRNAFFLHFRYFHGIGLR